MEELKAAFDTARIAKRKAFWRKRDAEPSEEDFNERWAKYLELGGSEQAHTELFSEYWNLSPHGDFMVGLARVFEEHAKEHGQLQMSVEDYFAAFRRHVVNTETFTD